MDAEATRAFEVLRDARNLIEQGWCQGRLKFTREDGTLAYCAAGALSEFDSDTKWAAPKREPYAYLWSAIHDRECPPVGKVVSAWVDVIWTSIEEWNDDFEREKDEVLAAFDRAMLAALLSQEEREAVLV